MSSTSIARSSRATTSHLQPGSGSSSEDHLLRAEQLLAQAADTIDDDARARLLDEAVVLNMSVARSIAARYRRRGIPDDDLEQVAYLGLVKAVHGFDPGFERDFLAYAVPTIRGEVKRYFRDHGWAVRPPRRLQELQPQIVVAAEELTQQLGRSPRPAELAAALGADEEETIEALVSVGSFTPTSLDQAVSDENPTTIGELITNDDSGPALAEARVLLAPAVRRLGHRDQQILYHRFFAGRTQSEIGQQFGISQMQVSRIIARILRQLHTSIDR